jgi:hypothetical protein
MAETEVMAKIHNGQVYTACPTCHGIGAILVLEKPRRICPRCGGRKMIPEAEAIDIEKMEHKLDIFFGSLAAIVILTVFAFAIYAIVNH